MARSIEHLARFAAREGISLDQLLAGLQPKHFRAAKRWYFSELGK